MTIKSLLLAMGITISTLSASDADTLGEKDVEPNADLRLLICAYSYSANDQTMMNLYL